MAIEKTFCTSPNNYRRFRCRTLAWETAPFFTTGRETSPEATKALTHPFDKRCPTRLMHDRRAEVWIPYSPQYRR